MVFDGKTWKAGYMRDYMRARYAKERAEREIAEARAWDGERRRKRFMDRAEELRVKAEAAATKRARTILEDLAAQYEACAETAGKIQE